MNPEDNPVDELVSGYRHREVETTLEHIKAHGVLENYLESKGITEYSSMENDYPYQAILGLNGPCSGEVGFNTHYTYELDGKVTKGEVGVVLEADDMATAIEKTVRQERLIDAAGVEVNEEKDIIMPSGAYLNPSSIHCAVFYDEPVPTENMVDWNRLEDGLMHKRTIKDALQDDSLGTALVMTGVEPGGGDASGTRIDYWTKFFDDTKPEGIDYTSLDWKEPGKL